jgi:hypothetical protein
MKSAFLLILVLLFSTPALHAQDIITLTSGTKVRAKVLEINPDDIKYKEFNNLDGPVITIQKNTVSEIRYANGTKTVINTEDSPSPNSGSSSGDRPRSGHFKRGMGEVRNSSGAAYKKVPPKNARIHGWYFGIEVIPIGISNATSKDPTYSTAGNSYSSVNLLATKMFNEHIGIQFGLGSETYSYIANFNALSSYPYANDVFSLSCLTIPVRAVYFSNSKRRAGLFINAGFDVSFLVLAKDEENYDHTSYYNSVLISPYVSSGVAFRNRYARTVWMFGLYYKTTLSNFYASGSGNNGVLNSTGLSVTYLGKFGRGR